MTEKTVTGVLHSVTDGTYFIEDADGQTTILVFDEEHDTPIQKLITLKIYQGDDGEWRVNPTGDYYTVAPERARAGPPGVERKHIALFRKLSVSAGEEEEAKELRRVQEKAQQLESFWKRFARHKWDVKVVGRTLRTDCIPDAPYFCKTVMRDAAKEIDEEGFDANYFHMWSTHQIGDNWCGHADLYGDAGVTYGGRCDIKSTIHEIGHNFGLHHANKDVREGADIEYGDHSCIMGSGRNNTGLNSPHVLFLGLASERETTVLEKSAQVLLCPAELPEHAMHESESKHVIVKPGGGHADTYVSLRKGKGFPFLPTIDEKTVYLHTMDRAGKSALLGTVKPGETASLPGRVGLSYHEYDGETARITFDFRDGTNVDDLTVSNDFPTVAPAVDLGPQHSGLWYDPDFNGQGFDINVRNGKMSLIWYTFNEKNDSRRFYIGTSDLSGGAEEFDLYTTDNGTFDNPSQAETILAGRAQLYFLDDSRAVFNFNMLEHGRGSIEITSLAASNSPNSGLWFQPSREKEGFGVQFFDHLNSCIAYWYTYGSGRTARGVASNKQRWFMCSGKKEGDEYNLTVYQVTGGSWLSFDPIDLGEVGTARLKVLDESHIDINYTVDTPDSIKGSGKYSLQRLL
jgi:hypothetical protein